MRKLFLWVGLSCVGLLAGCSGGSAAPSKNGGNPGSSGGPVALQSIALSPGNSMILPFASKQFTAKGTYSDGTTKDLTSQVLWSSTPGTVSTVSNAAPTQGLVHGLSSGVSVITAALGSVVNLTQLTVSSATLTSIAVTPGTANISLGAQQQFTATAIYSDGSKQDVTNNTTWMSDTPTVATITKGSGLVTAVSVSTSNTAVNISAQLCDAAGNCVSSDATTPMPTSAMLTVNGDNLLSITVQPGSASVASGAKLQFGVSGIFNDGSTRDLTKLASGNWMSSDTTVATIAATTGLAGGKFSIKSSSHTATITTFVTFALPQGDITCAGAITPSPDGTMSTCTLTGTATLTLTNPTLDSIAVTPPSASIAPGTQAAFTALGTFSDSSTEDLTSQVTWSGDTCTVSRLGIATGTSAGTCNITGAPSSLIHLSPTFVPGAASAALTVTSASLTSIAITPAVPVAAPGSTLQLIATGMFSDNSMQDITGVVKWTSSDGTGMIALVSKTGVITGEGIGSAVITATFAANSVTVSPVASTASALVEPLKSLAITAPAPSLAANGFIQLTATGTFPDGSTQGLTQSAIWSTSADTVARVGSAPGTPGLVTGLSAGSVTVTATFNGTTATLPLTVN